MMYSYAPHGSRIKISNFEITFFSIGHPSKVSSWSNVPYFLSKQLKTLGCTVNQVDIGPLKLLKWPYDLFFRILRAAGLDTEHDLFHSALNRWITNGKISRAIARYPNGLPLFLTYSFGARALKKPYVLFCDRTFEHHIQYFRDRAPGRLERSMVQEEDHNLQEAAMIISFFPEMAADLRGSFGNKVRYYGQAVNLPEVPELDDVQLERKWEGRQLLFIGKKHYREGLERLLAAMQHLNTGEALPYHLHVVGFSAGDRPGSTRNTSPFTVT